jgi:Cupredoxin-like domain
VNTPIFTHAIKSTNKRSMALSKLVVILLTVLAPRFALAWDIDFSRRQSQADASVSQQQKLTMPDSGLSADRTPASKSAPEEKTFLDKVFDTVVPVQDLVILNTEQGFVPSTLRVKEGSQYRIVVVNVNEKARNVSFVLDAFSEHHATFYGKIKSFVINPKKEGVYSYISPETSAQGRLVVYPAASMPPNSGPAVPTTSGSQADFRKPASE